MIIRVSYNRLLRSSRLSISSFLLLVVVVLLLLWFLYSYFLLGAPPSDRPQSNATKGAGPNLRVYPEEWECIIFFACNACFALLFCIPLLHITTEWGALHRWAGTRGAPTRSVTCLVKTLAQRSWSQRLLMQ